MDNLERNRSVRYELFSNALGPLVLKQVPKGYRSDTRSIARDDKSRGFDNKISIDLEFYGDGADYLTTVATQYGISEKVLLTKWVRDATSMDERWKFRYTQKIDMSKYKLISRTNAVTVGATEGGLKDEINTRQTDTYDLLDRTSADGLDIGGITTYTFQPVPRGIYTDSLLKNNTRGRYPINSGNNLTGNLNIVRTIPNEIVYNTMDRDVQQAWLEDASYDDKQHPNQNQIVNSGNLCYYQGEIDRSLRVKVKLKFTIEEVDAKNTSGETLKVEIPITTVNEQYYDILFGSIELLSISDPASNIGNEYTVDYDQVIKVYNNQSIGVVFNTEAVVASGQFNVVLSVSESKINIIDNTIYEVTKSRCMRPFDLFERIIAKITGTRNLFKSNLFGEGGEYQHMVVDNGFWARGFPDVYEDEEGNNKRIQFNTSFKDAFESFNYLEPLAWWIEVDGDKEVVRIEKATYTMKNFVGVVIDSADNIEHEISSKDHFSNIEIGHKKSVEYEEVNGLEEPNGKSEFTTHIVANHSKYTAVSEYRIDPIGYELTRRRQFIYFPHEDTNFDDHIWIHDAKFTGPDFYTHNLWDDLDSEGVAFFEYAPKGIYDPETAWNLRLSPVNRLFYGHGYSIKRGLYHYRNALVRFNSSNANQNMITKRTGGLELAENGSIQVSDIDKPKVEASRVNFSFRVTQALEEQFLGYTEISGELVPNIFGLIEFVENGEKKYVRLIKLDSSEEGKLTGQKARL